MTSQVAGAGKEAVSAEDLPLVSRALLAAAGLALEVVWADQPVLDGAGALSSDQVPAAEVESATGAPQAVVGHKVDTAPMVAMEEILSDRLPDGTTDLQTPP